MMLDTQKILIMIKAARDNASRQCAALGCWLDVIAAYISDIKAILLCVFWILKSQGIY